MGVMAETATCADNSAIPQERLGRHAPKPHLIKYRWTPERARAAQRNAMASRAINKAKLAALSQNVIDPNAIIAAEVRNIRAKLARARDPGAIKTLWSVLKDMLKASEPDQPKPEPSQTGPIKPLV